MVVKLEKRLFSVKEYHAMIQTGLLTENDPVELIRGEIVYKPDRNFQPASGNESMAVGRRHAACVKRLNALFNQRLTGQAIVSIQDPVEIDEYSEPEPDVCLLKQKDDFYESGHPKADDIWLLIEVADSTLESDRTIELPLYAENNISEVWIVDINAQQVEVYRQPSPTGYQSTEIFRRGQAITLQVLAPIAIAVDDILG
ncbi:Uma2 family endonuclease [Phormidesmis priestleyi]